MDKEIRMTATKLEIRDINTDNANHIISGYAIVFNQPSEDMGFIEYVDSNALTRVDTSKVLALYNHDYANVLARVDAGTLKLSVDDKGLAFTCQIPNTTLGADVFENVRNGNIQGCSFGFTVAEDVWTVAKDGTSQRLVKQLGELFEISLTTIPAYEQTSVTAVRSKHQNDLKRQRLSLELELIELLNKE